MFLEVVSIFSAMINRVVQKFFTRQPKPTVPQYTTAIREGIYPTSDEEKKAEPSTSREVALIHPSAFRKGPGAASATEAVKAKGLRIRNGFGRGGAKVQAIEGRRQPKMIEAGPSHAKGKLSAPLPAWRTSTPHAKTPRQRGSPSKRRPSATKSRKKGTSPAKEEALPTAAVVAASLAERKFEGSEPGSLVVEPPSEGVPASLEEVPVLAKKPTPLKSPRRGTAKKAPETLIPLKKSPKGRAPTPKKPATKKKVVSTQKPKKEKPKSTRRGQSLDEPELMAALAAIPKPLIVTEESHQFKPESEPAPEPEPPIMKPSKASRRKSAESPSGIAERRRAAVVRARQPASLTDVPKRRSRKIYIPSSSPRRLQSAFVRSMEEAVNEPDAGSDAFYDAVAPEAVAGEACSAKKFAPCTPPCTPTPVAGPSRSQTSSRHEAAPQEEVPAASVPKKRDVPERKPADRKGVGPKKIGRKGVSVMAKMRDAHSKKGKQPKQTVGACAPAIQKVCSAHIMLAGGRTCTIIITLQWKQPKKDKAAEKRAPTGLHRKA